MIHPVYADGPLRGKDFPVPGYCRSVQAIDTSHPLDLENPQGVFCPEVTYHLRQFGFHSGGSSVVLWIACSAPGEPEAGNLADLLLSDAAKAAMIT